MYNQEYDYPPETILSHTYFERHTAEFYRFYRNKMICLTAKPNAAHKKLAELGDGNVYAEFDGTVKAVRDPDAAYNNSEAVVELSGGGGYYVTGTLSEMDLGSVQVGDSVSISSWMTGAAC